MPGIITQMAPAKVVCNGLEAPADITWSGWEPGRDYTKNIVLKNLKLGVQKLKYKHPVSKVFTTMYPQSIALGAGNTFILPVTFHPLEKVAYEDKIEFVSNTGTFYVPIKAVIPKFDIEVPANVEFGNCAVDDTICRTIKLKNLSELCTPFQMKCSEPFTIEPNCGVLDPFCSVTVTATFTPHSALIYEENVTVTFGTDYSSVAEMKLLGIGKFPVILVTSPASSLGETGDRETLVNFGVAGIGQTVTGVITVKNVGPVSARFCVTHPLIGPNQVENLFKCQKTSGVIPAQHCVQIPLSYTGKTVCATSVDYMYIQACGSPTKCIIKCVGFCEGPFMTLSRALINFQKVEFGATASKPLELINESDCDATFQIDCDESVFKLNLLSGTLPRKSRKSMIVRFTPQHPINYYRRVPCLIHNQGLIYLELLGTCHSDSDKPPVLEPDHILRYNILADRGLSLMSPEMLGQMISTGQFALDDQRAIYKLNTEVEDYRPIDPIDEYLNDGYHSDTTILNMTNHTEGTIAVFWTGDSSHVFSVSPAIAEIPAQKSFSFRVHFKPTGPNMLFGSVLECYAMHKSALDFKDTDDKTHLPPWCLTLTATGHTFKPNVETFLPRFAFDSTHLWFTTLSACDSEYKTLALTNSGTTPILFDFEKIPGSVFAHKPARGLITPFSCQLFVVQFSPKDDCSSYKQVLNMRLNESDPHVQKLLMNASVELPDIELDNSGAMFFKPTCISTVTQRRYAVKNTTKVPLMFQWKVKNTDSAVLSVEPLSGIIYPNERQFHTWYFSPTAEEKYVIKPTLKVWARGYSRMPQKSRCKTYSVRVIGQGSRGSITCDEKTVNFGNLVVGTVAYQIITLANNSNCNLYYRLRVEQTVSGSYGVRASAYEPLGLRLSQMEGILTLRSTKEIVLAANISNRLDYTWTILHALLTADGAEIAAAETEEPLCHLTATGIYPTLLITDVRASGSAAALSKKQLWNLFSLDIFNSLLDGDPSTEELTYRAPTRHSLDRRPPVYTRAVLDFNFSSAAIGCEPCQVQLMLENNSPVSCEWAFLLPSDQQLSLQYWAETGEYTDEELHEMKVMDNKLFTIEPQKGKLDPGETCAVVFTYRHILVGTDRLPVLFKLNRGREILVNFIGVTVELDRHYLHFAKRQFVFAPVPIGETRSPVQVYEVYNGGAVPVSYELDCSPLREICRDNYSHPIFECLNPKGSVLPGCTAGIEWRFSPLEARMYEVDVRILIDGGETAVITFTGVGFDKRMLGDSMPLTDESDTSGVPSVQSSLLPGQLCRLSCERIAFGNIPLYAITRQILILKNYSDKHDVFYTWHVTSARDAQFVSIVPSFGTVKKGESVVVKVMFTAGGQPVFYDIDIICEVLNATECKKYSRDLETWNAEKERQKVEFTITEKNLNADIMKTPVEFDIDENADLQDRSGTVSPATLERSKYKTLPPIIRERSIAETRLDEKLKKRFDACYWPQPVPPVPFLLHLGLTARTHDLNEFKTHFPEQYNNFLIDRPRRDDTNESKTTHAVTGDNAECIPFIPCRQSEADMTSIVLAAILQSLMDDSGFHECCQKVMEEPTPYFQQVASRKLEESTAAPPFESDSPIGDGLLSGCQNGDVADVEPRPSSAGEVTTSACPPDDISRSGCMSFTRSSSDITPKEAEAAKLRLQEKQEADHAMNQRIKKSPQFASMAESLIENTLFNIVREAFNEEFSITARPRLVALPSRVVRNSSAVKKRAC